jgi:DmsE family decaheme c-type cytochrome
MVRAKHFSICLPVLTILALLISSSFGEESGKPSSDGYVGEVAQDACLVCHRDVYTAFKKENPHWRSFLDKSVPPDRRGCESCHGPGAQHINTGGKKEFIFSFKDKRAQDVSDVCLKCHQKQKEFFQFERGAHKTGAVGCSDCHRMHGTPPEAKLLKSKESDLCFSCHLEIKSKFYLPTRHKVLEGAMSCSDCHTPHGSRTRSSLRRWNKFNVDVCFGCHQEKRGPWVFEHPSVKFEGCSICHEPHGSPNRFLLQHRDVRRVCIQCHGQRHQGDFLFSTEVCINCHTQIHGSNFSSRFFQ